MTENGKDQGAGEGFKLQVDIVINVNGTNIITNTLTDTVQAQPSMLLVQMIIKGMLTELTQFNFVKFVQEQQAKNNLMNMPTKGGVM